MSLRRVALSLFPAPRRPVRLRHALPLALFSVVFGSTCLLLELTDILLYSAPRAFLLLLALPWIWWLHATGFSGLSGLRYQLALLVRFCVVGVFAVLLADPRAVQKSRALSVVYALDVSDSMGEVATDRALSYIARTAAEKPEGDAAGLVVFGREAGVELPPRPTFPLEAINCRVSRDATSLEKGLSLAAAVLPDENQGRIVLISDGTQTEGDYASVLDDLNARRIAVDVMPIEYDYADEVWLSKLELPRHVRLGETYEATVVLSSLRAGTGTLVLRENGEAIGTQPVQFRPGKNRFVLPIYLRDPGYYEYVATIEVPKDRDGWLRNNTAINYLYLKGEGKVLLVTDAEGDPREWQHLDRALREGKRLTECQVAYEFPRDPMSLMPYDCVVFVNVPADAFDVVQLQALRDAVYHQGTGFLMIGGKNSFGPGGYHRSAIEEALPVTMDITQRKVLPKGALAIILHTCEFPEGNTWGKRIAREAVRVLGGEDEVGILAYGYQGGESWLFELTPAREYERLFRLINQAQIGDMPSFTNTMRMGLDALKASDAATRHMIIISDGDPSPPPPQLVQDFVDNKVSVSMVAVFPHGGQDISKMRSIAGTTGGRYYLPQDPNLLPSIFIKEAKTLRRSMIQNKVFVPRVEMPSPVLKGMESLPELRGYVLTTPKPRATTILRGPSKEDLDPLLAVWRYGLGKTAAFTSDLSPNWANAWVEWDRYAAFVTQLITDISRVQKETNLRVTAFAAGANGIVVVDDHFPQESFLDIQARVAGPHGKTEVVEVSQVGPRRYQGHFRLWGRGRYRTIVVGTGDGRQERIMGGFAVPYSPEYLRFRSNPIVLSEVAERTGGRILTGAEKGEDIFTEDRLARSSSRSALGWFLIALVCLIPLDVGVRRIQLDLQVIRKWIGLGSAGQASGETFAALLKRKEQIEFTAGETRAREAVRQPAQAAYEKGPVRAHPDTALEATPDRDVGKDTRSEAPPPSTTERLLARKKKWKDRQE